MDEKITYGASVVFSLLALLLLVVNISIINNNRHLQESLGQNQAIIARGETVSRLNQGLVNLLAEASVKKNDSAIRDLLSSQGIKVTAAANSDAGDDLASKPKAADESKKPVKTPE